MNFKKRFRWSKNESKLTRQGVKYMANENVEDGPVDYEERPGHLITTVSYTHLTLPTNREV